MISVEVQRELAFPEHKVWALLSNFGDLSWTEGWEKLETEGEGIGMIRRIIMQGIDPIEEILESMDQRQQRFSYTIPNMPMPVTDYRSDVHVEAIDGDTTRVSWCCTASPAGISDADAIAMLEGTYGQN